LSHALTREAYQRQCNLGFHLLRRDFTVIRGDFTVILSSVLPSLSTPTHYLRLCSTFIVLQLATSNSPSTPPHRHRHRLSLDLSCNLPRIASVFVTPVACMAKRATYSCMTISATRFTVLPNRRLSGLHDETSYVLLRCYFSNAFYGEALCFKAPPIEWCLQLSQLKRIPALRTVSGKEDSARLCLLPSLRLEVYTDADSCSFLLGISGSPRNKDSSTLTKSRTSLAYLVPPRLAQQY
jgi:hypothetical protein